MTYRCHHEISLQAYILENVSKPILKQDLRYISALAHDLHIALSALETLTLDDWEESTMSARSEISFLTHARRIFNLRCPRCGAERLFSSWRHMNERCVACELDLVREPGFYLGSIYFNYGMTVVLVVPTYVVLVLGLGYSRDIVVWPCATFTALFPLWFYRYARAMWLSVMFRVSSIDFRQTVPSEADSAASAERNHN